MNSIRVFVIENSAIVQRQLTEILGQDPRLTIAGTAGDLETALRVLPRTHTDVIALGTWFPRTDVVKVTKRLMTEYPLPIVLVSSSEKEKLNKSVILDALKVGALAIGEWFPGSLNGSREFSGMELCSQLANMSQVKVVRHRPMLLSVEPPKLPKLNLDSERMTIPARRKGQRFEVIGIVASTGGPQALLKVLNDVPCDIDASILVVQHMVPSFMNGFVAWLDANCPLPVMLAERYQKPKTGTVYVAPPDVHLVMASGVLKLEAGEPVDGHCPSGSVLFQSMADSLIVVDTEANVVTVNRATVEMLGYDQKQLVGQPASLVCIDEGYQLTGARLGRVAL